MNNNSLSDITLDVEAPLNSLNPASSLEALREYVFADDMDDRARLAVQHAGMKPYVVEHMQHALDEYKLAERFAQFTNTPKNAVKPARVLDFGCGEGLFLHDFAELLEARGLLAGVELNGIDKNRVAIITAEEYAQSSKPPRPYLNFYVHDGQNPLEQCTLLRRESEPQPTSFDFIYASLVIEHLPQARQHVEKLYKALKPGGVIYFYSCDLVRLHAEFEHFHPTFRFFGQAVTKMIMTVNPGLNVGYEEATWLQEAGAENVQANYVATVVGGGTKFGRLLLKDMVMVARGTGRILVQRGVITQAKFDQMMSDLYSQLTGEKQGQGWFIETMARKPLNASS